VGYRNLEVSDTGDTEDGGIVTSDLVYEYKISESTTFIEIALIEAGDDNTFFQSETALRSQISGSLSSQISYLVKHNSEVPADTEKPTKLSASRWFTASRVRNPGATPVGHWHTLKAGRSDNLCGTLSGQIEAVNKSLQLG
jgi:hypothetical protein